MSANDLMLSARRAQSLHTCMLLGVDFVPSSAIARDVAGGGDHDDQAPEVARQDSSRSATVQRPQQQQMQHNSDKAAALAALRERHDAECPHCTVVTSHTQTVFGEGSPEAAIMFIGEAPGAEEDRTGRPFVGRAGQKLEEIIKAMGLTREDVYIANVLKARPPDNRTPTAEEAARCGPYLVEQIRIIQPLVLVTLGGPATKLILERPEGITRLRGIWASYDIGTRQIPVMPTFHPAYLLRNYTQETRSRVWSDIQAVMRCVKAGGVIPAS